MTSKSILFVDDEKGPQDLFSTAIEDWNHRNADQGRSFEHISAEDYESGIEALGKYKLDGALFDLRVRNHGSKGRAAPKGNDLAKRALDQLGIPIAIMTADDSVLSEQLRTHHLVKVFDKNSASDADGNHFDKAANWFGEQWGMLEVLSASKRNIEQSTASIFLQRIWPRWSQIAELEEGDREELIKIVTRQYLNHLADFMGLDDPNNVSWHPFENYVTPPLLADRAHTGDIFEFDDECWIVLTPQCDMATQKVENVILAQCQKGISGWKENLKELREATSKTKRKGPEKFLRPYVNQNLSQKNHFLPPLPGETDPVMVDFSKIKTNPLADLNEKLDCRVASISTPFLPNIVQRFGAYISRTGQPNLDIDRL